MSNSRRAVTLVELLLVAGLLAAATVAFVDFRLNAAGTDAAAAASQEYYQSLARLDLRLKDDLRSAVAVRKAGADRWVVARLADRADGEPAPVDVIWERRGRVVERKGNDGTERFDFGPYLERDQADFVFRIGE